MDLRARQAALRRAATRQRRLGVDRALYRLEASWVRALDRRGQTEVDPATGRTPHARLVGRLIGDDVWSKIEDAMGRGQDTTKALQDLHRTINEFGADMAASLRRTAPAMLRDHRFRQRGFERRLRAVWGPALDAFYAVYVGMEEIGSDLQQLHQDRDDDLAEALLALQARASLLMVEIHHSLSGGFPLGAWARARALHETAIIAELLSEHGREPGSEDLATRYLEHAVVDQAADLRSAARGGAQLDPELMADVEETLQELLARYGEPFGLPYGWARPLFPELGRKKRVTFARLEMLAATGLDRFHYRVGGHHVHSSAWTLHLNRFQRGNTEYRLTGPINRELDGPASVALQAAVTTTSAVAYAVMPAPPDPIHLLSLAALRELAWDVEPLLDEAIDVLDRREARVQRRRGPEQWRRNRTS